MNDELGHLILTELREIKVDMAIMKQDVSELKEDMTLVKKDVAGLKQDVSELKEDMVLVKQDIGDLKEDMLLVKQDVGSVKEGLQNLNVQLNGFEKRTEEQLTNVFTILREMNGTVNEIKKDQTILQQIAGEHDFSIRRVKRELGII